MSWLADVVYGALVWREKWLAGRAVRPAAAHGVVRPRDVQRSRTASHLRTGRRGEMLAYWYLRHAGYTIVARDRRHGARPGELDLVGWDGPVLAFVEVKTRTSMEAGPPELTVKPAQRLRIVRAAEEYVQSLAKRDVTYRFDIASVSWEAGRGFQVRLVKDAFRGR